MELNFKQSAAILFSPAAVRCGKAGPRQLSHFLSPSRAGWADYFERLAECRSVRRANLSVLRCTPAWLCREYLQTTAGCPVRQTVTSGPAWLQCSNPDLASATAAGPAQCKTLPHRLPTRHSVHSSDGNYPPCSAIPVTGQILSKLQLLLF